MYLEPKWLRCPHMCICLDLADEVVHFSSTLNLYTLRHENYRGVETTRNNADLKHSHTTCAISYALCWAEARVKIARMTLTIKFDGNWSSFQLANSAPPLSVTDSAIAPSARIL